MTFSAPRRARAAQAAATETRDRLEQRIHHAQDDLDQAAADTEQKASEARRAHRASGRR